MENYILSGSGYRKPHNFWKVTLVVFFLYLSVLPLQAQQSERALTGTVQTKDGIPLPGVTINVKGTQRGVITNMDGEYEMKVTQDDHILVFSYIGFKTEEIEIGDATEINLEMEEDASKLDEVLIVGFGTQEQKDVTGAISQVGSEILENRPVANVGQALQGAIPNLNIRFPDGSPNSNPTFNIRGGTSFSGGNFTNGSPLILIDGIESDINLLNPEDIENITVLKDAASAAIYGARAANGVVLVTTKRGSKNSKTTITYNTSFQLNTPSYTPDILDAYSIQESLIRAEELEGRTPSGDLFEKLDAIEQYMSNPNSEDPYFMTPGGEIKWIANTRVYDEAVRDMTPMYKHNLSLRGGSEKTTYYASLGYQNQEGFYKMNTDIFQRYNLMLNMGSEITDWLEMDYGIQYNTSVYTEPVSPGAKGGWWTAMSLEPYRNINMPMKTPEDSPVGKMYTDNILSFMDYGSSNKRRKELLQINLNPKLYLTEGWKIEANLAYKSYNSRRKQVVPQLERIEYRWDAPTTVHTNPSNIQKWYDHSDQYTINLFSDYTLNLGNHEIYGLAGFNQEWYEYEYLGGRGEDILSPNIPVIGQTLGNQFAYDNESHWAIRGAFYNLRYDYKKKYYVESKGRYDGTSRFPKDSRFKFFPSISAAWRVTEENFSDFLKPTFNEIKFRASYGALGNQNVANYIYIPSYGTIQQVSHLFGGKRPLGVTPPRLVDANLTWETSASLNFGVEMALFNKLDLSFDWYRRETSDILVAGDKFPAVLGTSAPTKNSGAMQTEGWELVVNWEDQFNDGFRYNIAFNLSDYQSEITSFDGNPNNLLNTLYEGQKMGEIWGYETLGLFQSEEEIENAPSQELLNSRWFPGDVQYADLNRDGEISPGESTVDNPGDRKVIGNTTPRYQFGLNMNAFWKNFDLNIFFQGVGKRDYWIGHTMHWGLISFSEASGTREVYENSWTPERTDAFYPAYKPKSANKLTQTKYLQNAAYLRLKNLAVGYSLPNNILEKLKMQQLRVSLSGNNVWELTDLPGIFDPEAMDPNYPMMRSFSLGLQASF